jgi:ABC-type bacteriocin/lantibiotic exporter with double-glycine peptidase domain
LYFEPKILVLDESTSALDKNNEDFLVKLFRKLKKDMTIVIIYHNPSISKICDKIIKLKNGRILT